jgi:hypothetical protein
VPRSKGESQVEPCDSNNYNSRTASEKTTGLVPRDLGLLPFGSGVLGVFFLLSPETHAGCVKSALLRLLVTLAASPQSQAQPAKKSGIYSHTLYQATCSTLPQNG